MDRNSGVLERVIAALRCDHICLTLQRPPHKNYRVLEHNCCITKNEIYGAIDVAFSVELPLRVDKKGVLISLKGTSIVN
jgi:hypothetical protein